MNKFLSFLLIIISTVLFSCNNNTTQDNIPSKFKPLIKDLDNQVKVDGNKVILVTDSLLYKTDASSFDNYTLVKIYQLRQQAFSNLKKMDSVLYAGEKIRTYAAKIPDSLAMAKSLLLVKGDIDFNEQKKLMTYLPSAIRIFSKLKMPFEEAKLSATYGAILVQSGDIKLAQFYLLRAYNMMEKMDSLKYLINISTNIGVNYERLKSNKLALEYYNKALQFSTKFNDSLGQVSTLINLATFYSQSQSSLDSVFVYYNEAKKKFPKDGPYYLAMKLDYNIALHMFNQKKYKQSEEKFSLMASFCQKNNLVEGYAYALIGLSEVYLRTDRIPLAVTNTRRAYMVFDSLGLPYDALMQAEKLIIYYVKSGNSQEAIKTMNIAKKLNDSIMSVEKQTAVLELESKYQTEKKVQEIILLKKDALYRQIIIIILITVALVFFFLYKKIKRTNHKLNISQQVLVDTYRNEKELRNAEREDDRAKIERLTTKAKDLDLINNLNSTVELTQIQLLTQYFEDSKPYLDSKLKQEDILSKTNMNAKALLKLLKENGFENFNAFLNSYRVNEAKLLIEMPENHNLKMEAIANKAGFGTRQSFYNAFETKTGLSPAFYRSKMLDISAKIS